MGVYATKDVKFKGWPELDIRIKTDRVKDQKGDQQWLVDINGVKHVIDIVSQERYNSRQDYADWLMYILDEYIWAEVEGHKVKEEE